jgi:hypothetical protein
MTAKLGVARHLSDRDLAAERSLSIVCIAHSEGVNASDFSNKATACARLGCEGFRGVNDGDTTDLG